MAKYTVESYTRLQAAFNMLVPNLNYLPGVLANNALNIQVNQTDVALKKNKIKIRPDEVYDKSRRAEFELKSEYAINPTFDEIIVSSDNTTYYFPLDPLVDVSFKNEVITTPITGGRDIIELVGESNPSIRIRGILWEGTGLYPKKSVKELLSIFREKKTLEVSSYLFNVYGIDTIFIEEVALPSMVGFEDTQPFEISAFGYKPIELEITENPTKNF
jgi:hypothetical protein